MREVIAIAALLGSAGIVLAHNHPSGDATPSAADRVLTRRLALLGEAMDVAILDHLVMGGNDCTSMRTMGFL